MTCNVFFCFPNFIMCPQIKQRVQKQIFMVTCRSREIYVLDKLKVHSTVYCCTYIMKENIINEDYLIYIVVCWCHKWRLFYEQSNIPTPTNTKKIVISLTIMLKFDIIHILIYGNDVLNSHSTNLSCLSRMDLLRNWLSQE